VVKQARDAVQLCRQVAEILDPFLARLHCAAHGGFQPETVAMQIAIGMALRLSAHEMRRLEGHRLRDLEHFA
jgi:hypothetical protein